MRHFFDGLPQPILFDGLNFGALNGGHAATTTSRAELRMDLWLTQQYQIIDIDDLMT